MTKADDKEINFRKEVTLMVSKVNMARTIRRQDSIREMVK